MKVQTSLRLDNGNFIEAKEILAQLGLNFSEAVNIFAGMIVQTRGLPFDVRIPNKTTQKAIKDARAGVYGDMITLDELKASADA
jgi:DNA-damage-inducible protein J